MGTHLMGSHLLGRHLMGAHLLGAHLMEADLRQEAGEETALQRKMLALFDEADWPWEADAMVAEGYAALS